MCVFVLRVPFQKKTEQSQNMSDKQDPASLSDKIANAVIMSRVPDYDSLPMVNSITFDQVILMLLEVAEDTQYPAIRRLEASALVSMIAHSNGDNDEDENLDSLLKSGIGRSIAELLIDAYEARYPDGECTGSQFARDFRPDIYRRSIGAILALGTCTVSESGITDNIEPASERYRVTPDGMLPETMVPAADMVEVLLRPALRKRYAEAPDTETRMGVLTSARMMANGDCQYITRGTKITLTTHATTEAGIMGFRGVPKVIAKELHEIISASEDARASMSKHLSDAFPCTRGGDA